MGEKASILIVDDNISMCKTMSFILRHKGYSVISAYDGPEAIERVKEDPFDIIFMDIKMPSMDGVKTYKKIKKIRPEAVVVMMTAYAVKDLVQEVLEKGAYGIIYKPLDMEEVGILIEKTRENKLGAQILVVDDDPGSRITFKNILKKKGHQVEIADTGEKAIAMVKEKVYNIIFIDIKLPGINGVETYLKIKEVSPDIAVIMMTAYRQQMVDLTKEAFDNNAFTCIYKPFDLESVFKLIEKIQTPS